MNILDLRHNLDLVQNLSAAEQAIEYIKKTYEPPYHLMLSGGVDSQAMLYAWNKFAKGEFIATSVIYDGEKFFNSHDICWIEKLAEKWNVDLNFIEFDILDFYKKRYYEIADEYECSSPQISVYIEMTKDIPGTVIFSGNWINWLTYNKVQHALTLYSQKRSCVPFFFLCQPSIAYTGLNLRKKIALDGSHASFERALTPIKSYESKVREYQLAGYPVISQGYKYSGFEKIKKYYDEIIWPNLPAKDKMFYSKKSNGNIRAFDLILRFPLQEKYREIDFQILFNT